MNLTGEEEKEEEEEEEEEEEKEENCQLGVSYFGALRVVGMNR